MFFKKVLWGNSDTSWNLFLFMYIHSAHTHTHTHTHTRRVKVNGSGWFMSGLVLTPLSRNKINVSDEELLGLVELILYSTLCLAPFSSLSCSLCMFKPTWVSFFFCRTLFFWCVSGHALWQRELPRNRKHQHRGLKQSLCNRKMRAQKLGFLSPNSTSIHQKNTNINTAYTGDCIKGTHTMKCKCQSGIWWDF